MYLRPLSEEPPTGRANARPMTGSAASRMWSLGLKLGGGHGHGAGGDFRCSKWTA
jgi:hypothetical protein